MALLFSRYASNTLALAEESEAETAVVKRVAANKARAFLLPSDGLALGVLACWALMDGNLEPETPTGDATEGMEMSFALRSEPDLT